jgi:hypothetical protein
MLEATKCIQDKANGKSFFPPKQKKNAEDAP